MFMRCSTPIAMSTNGSKTLLQLGGIGGIIGGVFLAVAYGLLYPPHTCCTDEFFRELPQFFARWLIHEVLLISGWALTIPLFLSLYTSLKPASPRAALLCAVFGIFAAGIASVGLALGVPLQLALANVYAHAADADKATVITVAKAVQGSAAAGLPLLFLSLPVAFLAVASGALRCAAFHKRQAWTSVILAAISIVAVPVSGILMFLQVPFFYAIIIVPPIVWFIFQGLSVYLISRQEDRRPR